MISTRTCKKINCVHHGQDAVGRANPHPRRLRPWTHAPAFRLDARGNKQCASSGQDVGASPRLPPATAQHQSPTALEPVHHQRRLLLVFLAGGLVGWSTDPRGVAPPVHAVEGVTTVFVAGATGNTGRRVVEQLRRAGIRVRAGVRSTSKALSLGFGADPGIQIVEADVTKDVDSLAAAIGDAQAVICATGAVGFGANGAGQVDEQGTITLVNAALKASAGTPVGLSKFVLVSSLLTNGAAAGQLTNPSYLFLNLFGGVLLAKLKAEQYLRSSGLNYTIIRPGGLSNEPEEAVGNLIVSGEDTLFALETDPGRAISRDTVAAVAVQAVLQPDASRDKVVEIVASPTAPVIPRDQWFAAV